MKSIPYQMIKFEQEVRDAIEKDLLLILQNIKKIGQRK